MPITSRQGMLLAFESGSIFKTFPKLRTPHLGGHHSTIIPACRTIVS